MIVARERCDSLAMDSKDSCDSLEPDRKSGEPNSSAPNRENYDSLASNYSEPDDMPE